MNFRIQMFPFMTYFVSFHHPIISTGLKDLIPMFLGFHSYLEDKM